MLVHIDNVKYKCKPSKMEISVQELDKEGFKLNTPDGIVDLQTRKIYPHDPKDYCTKMTAVSPSLEGMDEWRDFLDRLICGDKSLQDYLQICSSIIRYNTLFADKEKVIAKAQKQEQTFLIEQFIHALTKYERPLTEWDEAMWQMTVDTVTAQPDGKLLFRFQDGTVVEGCPIDAVYLFKL